MKIVDDMSDPAIASEFGRRLMAERLARNLTQTVLAEKAGVAMQTVVRLEAGSASTGLTGLIRIIRALGLLERLDQLFPESGPNPMDLAKLHGKRRQRASRVTPHRSRPAGQPWTWGE